MHADPQRPLVLRLERVALPGRLRVVATVARGEWVGIALRTPDQRKAVARKVLGYESPEGVFHYPEGPVATFSDISKAILRSHVGTNLPTRELCTGGLASMAAARVQRKVEEAKSLLEAFDAHMKYLLSGLKDLEKAPQFLGPRRRFLHWLASVGLRHAASPSKLEAAGWSYFWLAVALGVGERLVVLVDPLAQLDLLAAMRAPDVLRLFRKQEPAACLVLAESSKTPIGPLCDRWIEPPAAS
jgi:hypothetical protein